MAAREPEQLEMERDDNGNLKLTAAARKKLSQGQSDLATTLVNKANNLSEKHPGAIVSLHITSAYSQQFMASVVRGPVDAAQRQEFKETFQRHILEMKAGHYKKNNQRVPPELESLVLAARHRAVSALAPPERVQWLQEVLDEALKQEELTSKQYSAIVAIAEKKLKGASLITRQTACLLLLERETVGFVPLQMMLDRRDLRASRRSSPPPSRRPLALRQPPRLRRTLAPRARNRVRCKVCLFLACVSDSLI